MNSLKIRETVIGEGMPKICVPIVGKTKKEILSQARQIHQEAADIAEWRMDKFEEVFSIDSVWEVLKGVRKILGNIPIIATLRTIKEGGLIEVDYAKYEEILLGVAKSGMADLIDVEAFSFGEISEALIEQVHMCGGKVIVSNHDFVKTPPEEELVNRLKKMQNMGADISKIAVMPQKPVDVLTLMSATYIMWSEYADRPIISISMAGQGSISRIGGEIFGSSVTFATVGYDSAPGQMPITALKLSMEAIHKNLAE